MPSLNDLIPHSLVEQRIRISFSCCNGILFSVFGKKAKIRKRRWKYKYTTKVRKTRSIVKSKDGRTTANYIWEIMFRLRTSSVVASSRLLLRQQQRPNCFVKTRKAPVISRRRSTTTTNTTPFPSKAQKKQNRRSLTTEASTSSSSTNPTTTTTTTTTATAIAETEIDVCETAQRLGIRLTETEFALLRTKLDTNGDGIVSNVEIAEATRVAIEERSTREIFLSVVEMPTDSYDRFGTRIISFFDYVGTVLFAVVGTQVAGDAGMNIIGCTLIGCTAAMGGGTLNSLVYGSASPMLGRSGVFWAKNYKYLAAAMTASIATFFAWPAYCRSTAESYLTEVIGKDNLEDDGTIGKETFIAACRRNEDFMNTIRIAFPELNGKNNIHDDKNNINPELYFEMIDKNKSGTINRNELEILVQKNFDNSFETYVCDTIALSAFSVAAVHGAINVGLHPLVAMTSGVTICFGGLLRDVFCSKNLAIAGQSYAFATGAGSTVYVLLRELALRGHPLPLIARIVLSAGTCAGMRVWEYIRGEPLLAPMHKAESIQNDDEQQNLMLTVVR